MSKIQAVWITDPHLSDSTIEVGINSLNQALDIAVKNKCPLFLGGDIFTSRMSQSLQVLLAFYDFVKASNKLNVPIFTIAGNHDKTDYFSELSFLHLFEQFTYFQLISKYKYFDDLITGIRCHFVPYFDESVYGKYLEEVEIDPNKKNFLFTHIAVNGVNNNDGSTVEDGASLKSFEVFDKVFLGHYHNAQEFNNIVYTGSSHQADFGEDINKGVTLFYDNGTYELQNIEFPIYDTIEIDASSSADDFNDLLEHLNNSDNDHYRVKIIDDGVTDNKSRKKLLEAIGVKVEVKRGDIIMTPETAVEMYKPITDQEIEDDFETWVMEKKPKDEEFGRNVLFPGAKKYYYYHPESESIWYQNKPMLDEELGLIEHLDEKTAIDLSDKIQIKVEKIEII